MADTRKTRALLVARVIVSISLGTVGVAALCPTSGQIPILTFPEIDPPGTPSGQVYSKLLVPSDADNLTIHILEGTDVLTSRFPSVDFFRIQYNTTGKGYYVSMMKAIDRDGLSPDVGDDINNLQYRLSCTWSNASAVSNLLNIHITDVNDNSPVFTGIPYRSNISELQDPGDVVLVITTTDLDDGVNKQAGVYSLSTSPGAMFDGARYFTVSAYGQGTVTITAYLDFESMYLATKYQSSLVYFNVTVTARDKGSPVRSSSTTLIITVVDVDDQGPEFLYPSCITSSEEQKPSACVRPKYRSSISSGSDQVTTLQLTPDPRDAGNPDTSVNMIMQDKDTLDSPVICNVSDTIPTGYNQWFQTKTSQLGQTKQYKCEVMYVPGADTSNMSLGLPNVELIIKAQETQFYNRSEYASILVTITDSTFSYCPAGYSTEATDSGAVICTARPEADTGVAIGLGIALGLAFLIIIILVVVGIIVFKRRKAIKDKGVPDYSTMDMAQRDRHSYLGLNTSGAGPRTSGDSHPYSNQSDMQMNPPYQAPIYDELVDGSGSGITRSIPEDVVYVNAAMDA